MDSLKKATGLGLTADESYARAYEKAVLLGPTKFGEAVRLFDEAATKAAEKGNPALQARALANARLYAFITSGDDGVLPELARLLRGITEIEQIGSRTEMLPAATVAAEIEARIAEAKADALPYGSASRATAHTAVADVFKTIFSSGLQTYKFKAADAHIESAQERFFYHQGMSFFHLARGAATSNPETAAEHIAESLAAFRQAKDEPWAGQAQTWLSNYRLRRTCWMCHREFQGGDVHFRSYPAAVHSYAVDVVKQLAQDASSLDESAGCVVLCLPCGSAVEKQADRFAQQRTTELREETNKVIGALNDAVLALNNRIKDLERTAHRH
jgi:hypothetical protein